MFWIHGGAFVFGSGADSFYDGAQLAAAGNVVVVTINYRLGALGFLAHPALTAESSSHPTSGNYGFEDQQAALRWVKDNAAAFNGDPGNVTIFGESAGGYSVCAHLVAPDSQGLFHRAISESGVCSSPVIIGTRDFAQRNGEALASDLGCTDSSTVLTCLRGKTPADFLGAFASSPAPLPGGLFFNNYAAPPAADAGIDAGAFQGSQTWGPVTDGVVIPTRVADVGAGFAKVPLLLGTNANEGTLFTTAVFNGVPVANDAEYVAALTRAFGASATDVVTQYPSSSFPTVNDALSEVAGDAFFVCPARRLARNAAAAGSSVYLYGFAHVVEQPLIPNLGAFHASELLFVFGAAGLASLKPDEQPLLDTMQGYWTRFARNGDPNGGSAPSWPKYAASGDQNQSLDLPTSSAETGHKKAKCDFWDTLYK
jgi:para-nitrobenzyl esterase